MLAMFLLYQLLHLEIDFQVVFEVHVLAELPLRHHLLQHFLHLLANWSVTLQCLVGGISLFIGIGGMIWTFACGFTGLIAMLGNWTGMTTICDGADFLQRSQLEPDNINVAYMSPWRVVHSRNNHPT